MTNTSSSQWTRRNARLATSRAVGALMLAGGPVVVSARAVGAAAGDKVTICHRTGSQPNPYVQITGGTGVGRR